MKLFDFLVPVVSCAMLASCSTESAMSGGKWTPVRLQQRPPVSFNDVLVIDVMPAEEHVRVGYMQPPKGAIIRVSFEDTDLLMRFKQHAAEMGANTVVLLNTPIQYTSGMTRSTKVELLYVKDEGGSHGGDEFNIIDESFFKDKESFQLY